MPGSPVNVKKSNIQQFKPCGTHWWFQLTQLYMKNISLDLYLKSSKDYDILSSKEIEIMNLLSTSEFIYQQHLPITVDWISKFLPKIIKNVLPPILAKIWFECGQMNLTNLTRILKLRANPTQPDFGPWGPNPTQKLVRLGSNCIH